MVKIREDLPRTINGEIDLTQWIQRLAHQTSDIATIDAVLLQKIGLLSFEAGAGVLTAELDTCYKQGLYTAERLAILGADNDTLAAALLYDSYCYGNREKINHYLQNVYPQSDILNLLHKLVKIDAVIEKKIRYHERNQKNLKHMIVALANDHRVILIKLANHISALRACANPLHFETNENRRLKLSEQARYIYGPLANRLGIGKIKWELEDYAFRYLEPQDYKKIATLLDEKRSQRDVSINSIKEILQQELIHQKIDAVISGRAKHIYSIFRKMTRKHVDFKEIYDVYAMRIIVSDIPDCYAALGVVHSLWPQISKEFDDYIATPKKNGYRSLHTAVMGPQGKPLEVQIRTKKMHENAEFGVAAHWIYKEATNENSKQPSGQKLSTKKIYVFSPRGDVVELPVGATPLDFAYQIHTELGHRCRGAKVHGKMVTLTYPLQLGDEVEVLSVKIGGPSRDWSNIHAGYLKSARALSKVNLWFRHQEMQVPVKELIKIAEKKEKKEKLEKLENSPAVISFKKTHGSQHNESNIQIAGLGNLLCHFAKCCKPLPGDHIIGYITHGHGVTIHRQDCVQIHTYGDDNPRLISVDWGSKFTCAYPVDIMVTTADKQSILRDIMTVFANEKLHVIAVNAISHKNDSTASINLTLEIADLIELQKMISKILQIPKVFRVKRV